MQFISSHLQTSDNQFGFKAKHGANLCAFLLKQSIASYVNQNTPVYAALLDVSKAYDRVNHAVLFKKLIAHNVQMCFVRLFQFWYSHQSMQVRWGGSLSRLFKVTNGVRQGRVLSPDLFAIYTDDLSQKLNKLKVGIMINDSCLNHILFADDL